MSRVDEYLADLRAALGERLPPAVHEARLREVRSHLLESAEDVGEAEAIRRYGRARAAAGGLVRAHRGYGAKSPWRLTLPTFLALLAVANAVPMPWLSAPVGLPTLALFIAVGRAAWLLVALAFAARVSQTRRWLAWPPIAANASAHVALLLANHYWMAPWPWFAGQFAELGLRVAASSAAWLALNATALGLGRLLDARVAR